MTSLDPDARSFFEGLLTAMGASIVLWAAVATLIGRLWP